MASMVTQRGTDTSPCLANYPLLDLLPTYNNLYVGLNIGGQKLSVNQIPIQPGRI